MIEQEAIRIIRYRIDTARAVCGSGKDGRAFEDLEMAIEALNKQIPKKPTYEGDGYWNGHIVYDTWICPCCGKSYELEYEEYDYCPNCGQKLDWRDKP